MEKKLYEELKKMDKVILEGDKVLETKINLGFEKLEKLIKHVDQNQKDMDSKMWIVINANNEKNTINTTKIFSTLGFTDEGITRYNGIITKIEKLEALSDKVNLIEKNNITLQERQNNILKKTALITSLITAGIITILSIVFKNIINKL